MHRVLVVALVLLLSLAGCGASPPATTAPVPTGSGAKNAPPVAVDDLNRPLPLDSRVKKGKLDNGLTYYILPHEKPAKRAQIWLAVNAGSVLEDDDQRGLAHFVEHMSFNGTKRFPKQALVDFVEKSGVRFGPDLNAYTSFDETVYMLQVPTDKPELVGKAITVLRDWADGVTFDPEEVEKERGVVLEEWRLGRGAGMRLFDKQAPVLFNGSKYADRIAIGKPEIIKKAPREALVRFYRDWYRPDLMAVVAVGDFAPADIEKQIKSEFASLAGPTSPRPRPLVKVPPHDKTLVTIESDPEMPETTVSSISELPHRPERSARDYRRDVAERLFNSMLNARFDEIRRQPDAPFLSAGSSTAMAVRDADNFRQSARVKGDSVLSGYGALLEEVLRVDRHGFTSTEFERAKSQLLRQYQQSVKESDKHDSRGFASEMVRNFLVEETMPGPEAELALVEKFLPTYSLAELNQLGKTMNAGSHVISVAGPTHMAKVSPEALLATSRTVEAREIKPYEDGDPNAKLIAQTPTPGPVVKTRTIPEIGVTEWTLKNGVRVVVKPTNFSNDEVRMSSFSPGGSSLAKDADWESAKFADTVVAQGGVGPFDATKLRKSLAGKIASVSTRIGELDEGVFGSAAPGDLETMLQLTYLAFTAPRRDDAAFAAWRGREIENVKNRRLVPETTFYEDLTLFETQNHPRRKPTTPELLQKINWDKVMAFYKDRFGDAGDFTFVFVGNVDLDGLKPLVETYLGSLSAKGRKETWRDVNVSWPAGALTKTFTKGSEPKSSVSLVFHGPAVWSRDTDNEMRMLSEVLGMRLREVLREDMGGVYGVRASGGITRRPREQYIFSVDFGCAPENVDKLVKAVFDEIKSVQDKGIGDDYITKVKEQRRRSHETNLRENGFWDRELERAYTFGDDPKLILDITAMTEKVTSDHVRAAAKKYLSNKDYVLGVLKPETASAAPTAGN